MLRWRALLFVLLFLSLPIRTGLAASLPGNVPPAVTAAVGMRDTHGAEMRDSAAGQHLPVAMTSRTCDHGSDGTMRLTHAAGQCGVCAPCYTGAAVLLSAVMPPARDVRIVNALRPASDAATSFLTEGIDGPPPVFLDGPFAAASGKWAMNRRGFLRSAFAGAAALALQPVLNRPAQAGQTLTGAGTAAPVQLAVVRRTIEVNGRAASVYGIQRQDGTPGLRLREGDAFNVALRNETSDPTSVHWHGLTPPWPGDGVPNAPLPLIAAGAHRTFDFPVGSPGTYWMHAHTLQEQQLLAAPLIVADAGQAKRDEQEVVILLHDFSFASPQELLTRLTQSSPASAAPPAHRSPGSHSSNRTNHDAMAMDQGKQAWHGYVESAKWSWLDGQHADGQFCDADGSERRRLRRLSRQRPHA
ncbi:multicopper oxidase domain-containing protein [Paraburkholderia phenoliruptrix]|jgi:hypothetical protein|uniref:multicopper oxidase domain-containing protein n=1 Tax=Paraburkholderia phenoliruptrix TaxID=252970 RepID=UPI001FC8B5EE|nr:multicopper oxidase domain-containing protein [Paraburkholderia phenoliruptrix]